MRVISQWKDVDLDYETSSFLIVDNYAEETNKELLNVNDRYVVLGVPFNSKNRFAIGAYSKIEYAQEALIGMSNHYTRYLITDNDNYMTMTDAIDCELDTPFNKISVKELKATAYLFPTEEQLIGTLSDIRCGED